MTNEPPRFDPGRCREDYLAFLRHISFATSEAVCRYFDVIEDRLLTPERYRVSHLRRCIGLELVEPAEPPPERMTCAVTCKLTRPLRQIVPISSKGQRLEPVWVAEAVVPWLRVFLYWHTMPLYTELHMQLPRPRPPRPSNEELADTFARLFHALYQWLE